MRRVALLFALIALISAALRVITPERIFATVANVVTAPERFGRAVSRLCLSVSKRLRPLLPQAN